MAVSLEFLVKTDAGEQPSPRMVAVTVTDARGKTVLSANAYRRRGAKTTVYGFATKPGKYRVKASTKDGKRAETDITVGTKRGDPMKIVLK